MYAHDHQLEALEEAAMAFIEENPRAFHREAMPTLSVLAQRPHLLLLAVIGLLMAGVDRGVPGGSGAVGGVGAAVAAGDAADA